MSGLVRGNGRAGPGGAVARRGIGCVRRKIESGHRQPAAQCAILDAGGAVVCPGTATDYLGAAEDGCFDIAFLDPPFADDSLDELCRLIDESGLLASGANVYLEQDRAKPEPALPDGWSVLKNKTAGNVRYMLVSSGHRN